MHPLAEDLTGQKFNKLTALEYMGPGRVGALWRCKCDCGKETKAAATRLKTGKTKSCGCMRKWSQERKEKYVELHNKRSLALGLPASLVEFGTKVGNLTVIDVVPSGKTAVAFGMREYYCWCACGNLCTQTGERLTRRKPIKSCGCGVQKYLEREKRRLQHAQRLADEHMERVKQRSAALRAEAAKLGISLGDPPVQVKEESIEEWLKG